MTHMHLDWAVDFAAATVSGRVDYTVRIEADGVAALRLDTRDLDIRSVSVEGAVFEVARLDAA